MGDNLNNKPLVSVIITSYNRATMIVKAIESALEQDYENIEIIISDNASNDNSNEVIQSYCHDSRIKYSRNETNIGMLRNFKKATDMSLGKYVTYLSSDDFFVNKNFIKNSILLTQKYTNVGVVCGKSRTIYSDNIYEETQHQPFWDREFWNGLDVFFNYPKNKMLYFGGSLFEKSLLQKENIFDETINGNDVFAILTIALQSNFCFLNEICYNFRVHDDNHTSNQRKLSFLKSWINSICEKVPQKALSLYPTYSEKIEEWNLELLKQLIKYNLLDTIIIDNKNFKYHYTYFKEHYPSIITQIEKEDKKLLLFFKIYHPKLFQLLRYIKPKVYSIFKNRMKNNTEMT